MNDGDHFGEIALLNNEPRVASVVAVTNCELFKLSRKDFSEAVARYPSVYRKIERSALQRLERTKKIISAELSPSHNLLDHRASIV